VSDAAEGGPFFENLLTSEREPWSDIDKAGDASPAVMSRATPEAVDFTGC